jgi:6-phosphogluconolactonase (cycloisomerase 2 family)
MSERRAAGARRLAWTIFAVAAMALTGCDGFFVPVNPVPPVTTGNYVYVANSATNSLNGFAVGTGTLTAVPGSPVALQYAPVAMAISRDNRFLYVSSAGSINVYGIGSDGSLTATTGTGVTAIGVASMDVSPDGQWLLALGGTSLLAQVNVYQRNTSTGALTLTSTGQTSVANAVIVPRMLRISPNGTLVFAALGTGGDAVFSFDTATGALGQSPKILTVSATTSDNGLAVDNATANLYIARSGTGGGVRVFKIGTDGSLTEIARSPFASGGQAYTVVLDSTGKYAYAANRLNGTIYGYAVGTGGGLTALDGSPYGSGLQVSSLDIDSTGVYLLAAAFGGTPDLSMYSIDTTTPGKLIPATSASMGTDPAGSVFVVATHPGQ